MDRGRKARPMVNRICLEKEQTSTYRKHRERLARVKSTVDTRAPSTFRAPHMRVNRKREVMLEERYASIEKANKQLLRRMSSILNAPPSIGARRKTPGPVPTNRGHRRKELARITEENQAILRRIQDSHATYNSAVWEEEAKVAHRRMERLCFHKPGAMGRSGSRASMARSSSAASMGMRRSRPASAPVHRRDVVPGGYAGATMDMGAPDMVGAVSRDGPVARGKPRPASAHPRYATHLTAWRNDEEKAQVARGLHSTLAEVEEALADSDVERDFGADKDDNDDDDAAAAAAAHGMGHRAGASAAASDARDGTAWARPRDEDRAHDIYDDDGDDDDDSGSGADGAPRDGRAVASDDRW